MFYARGFAPCIPATKPARHWFALPLWKTQWGACLGVADSANVSGTRRGAQGGSRPPTLPLRCSQGGLPALSPAYATFSLLFCPYPPSPLPGGKGETLGCFMQGASPLASPGLTLRGTGKGANHAPSGGRRGAVARRPCRCGVRRGACLLCRPPTLPLACFSAPIPPSPLPGGKGETLGYFVQGASPLASPRLNPRLAAKPTGSDSL